MDGGKRYVQQVLKKSGAQGGRPRRVAPTVQYRERKGKIYYESVHIYRKNNGGPGASGNGERDKHCKVYIGGARER